MTKYLSLVGDINLLLVSKYSSAIHILVQYANNKLREQIIFSYLIVGLYKELPHYQEIEYDLRLYGGSLMLSKQLIIYDKYERYVCCEHTYIVTIYLHGQNNIILLNNRNKYNPRSYRTTIIFK